MKRRLLLSALSCVLALGLVSACNNEEEDLSGGDTGTQTDGGGSGSDTSGTGGDGTTDPGTTEAVTIENYTLAFTFMVGDTEDTIPEGATIYYIGSTDEWTDFIPLEEGKVTFETIDTGTYSYKLVIYDGEDDVTWNNCYEITTSDQTFVVSEEDEGGQPITIKSSYTLEEILGGAIKPAEGTIDVTIALENTEEEPVDETSYTWYFDGFDWLESDEEHQWIAQRTLTAYDGEDYSYDYYITIQDVDLSADYTFAISLYEYADHLTSTGIAPSDELEIGWSEENFYLWGTQYNVVYQEEVNEWGGYEDWDNSTYSEWGLGFSNLTSACGLEEAEELTVVLQLDFSQVTNAWDAVNNVVSGFYFLVDGEPTAE